MSVDDWPARAPNSFPPPWASAWGDDRYGLWADAEIALGTARIVQRLRWIEPGQFLMGSPEKEEGSPKDLCPQHRVILSEGLWLADTACTQGLWQAVTGENPSRFKGLNEDELERPVEQVSWKMIQDFLKKLNVLLPGCQASLPTEAEWEYACRAGSTGPFSFGEIIGPDQVNYDGNFPYADAAPGEYRARTVKVKELPANAWGLHQMHGNVWEWCADRRRKYEDAVVVDPGLAEALAPLPEDGAERALRGGAWIDNAEYARSAYRLASAPDKHSDSTGFRFALRSTRQAGTPEA